FSTTGGGLLTAATASLGSADAVGVGVGVGVDAVASGVGSGVVGVAGGGGAGSAVFAVATGDAEGALEAAAGDEGRLSPENTSTEMPAMDRATPVASAINSPTGFLGLRTAGEDSPQAPCVSIAPGGAAGAAS